jgi:hypothetical protein
MKTMRSSVPVLLALVFLLAGLAGLMASGLHSSRYLATAPRTPAPEVMRTVPRTLNGEVVYLTLEEDLQLSFEWQNGVRAFGLGIALIILYLGMMAKRMEQWDNSCGRYIKEDNSSSARSSRGRL